jgi:hypothetical protein
MDRHIKVERWIGFLLDAIVRQSEGGGNLLRRLEVSRPIDDSRLCKILSPEIPHLDNIESLSPEVLRDSERKPRFIRAVQHFDLDRPKAAVINKNCRFACSEDQPHQDDADNQRNHREGDQPLLSRYD